jgi:hypothetical protein
VIASGVVDGGHATRASRVFSLLLRLSEGKVLTLSPSPDQALSITPVGEDVLAGNSNWLDCIIWITGLVVFI